MRLTMKRAAASSILVVVMLLAVAVIAEAQQPTKIPRIGYLTAATEGQSVRIEAFWQGLRELGYVEGKNIVIEYRYAEGVADRFPNLAAELVKLKADIIVVSGTPATQAAKNATKTIPILMSSVADPVGTGLIASLAHPGGNVTGLSNLYEDLGGKQLELLKEAFPKISRMAVLWDPVNVGNVLLLKNLKVAAGTLRITLQPLEVHVPDDLESAFAAITREGASALSVLMNSVTGTYRSRIVDFAAKSRLPAIYGESRWVDAGGLMSYGPDYIDIWRRTATYVDKILKGAKPAELPVQQPTKFEFVINLKAAKQIGLTIPPNVLARADRVIK